MSRWTTACIYFNTMFFNFLFRVILVRFADRGLVAQGKPNLVLFHQLYWTISLPFLFIFIVNYPIKAIVNGSFRESTQARICLQMPLDTDEASVLRGRITSLIFPCLAEIINRYFSTKVATFLRGLCPNNKMGCIGKFGRNLIDFGATSKYISCWALYACLDGLLVLLAMKSQTFTSQNFYNIYNAVSFVFIDIFHGLVIPLNMDLSWTRKHTVQPFYMNCEQILVPRRYTEGWPRGPGKPPSSPVQVKRKLARHNLRMLLLEEEMGMPMVEVSSTIRYCSKCSIKDRKERLEKSIAQKLKFDVEQH